MAKKLLSLTLALFALAAGLSNISSLVSLAENKSVTFAVDNENAGRGDGELIIYTRSGEHTGTNQWGYEVCVNSEGMVISTGGNDNLIPDGGFVVSGHNSITEGGKQSAAFLKDNVSVGDYIIYNRRVAVIIVTDKKAFPGYDIAVNYNGENRHRGEEETIIYTAGATTDTNIWGFEVCVDKNGLVISVGGNNNSIPTGGYVVSGHNTAGAYLKVHILVGMTAILDRAGKTVTFTYTPYTMYLSDLSRLNELYDLYDRNAENCLVVDYEKASEALEKAKTDLESAYSDFEETGDYMAYFAFSEALASDLNKVSALLSENIPVEYRGVWIRPVETTRSQVANTVQTLYDKGINTLCIETMYNGYMIMPTPEGSLYDQNPAWKGFDMLQAFIEECHSRQMELHLWLPVFYTGHTNTKGNTLYDKKPEWRLEDRNGNTVSDDTFLFVNPCNSEVQDFLIETYKYIVTTYDIDGLQLDYIRFPNSEWGFNKEIVDGFKAKTGITVTGYDPSASWWKSFCEYRASFVTQFVGKVRNLIDDFAPGVILSADVFPDVSTSVTGVCQDYATWIRNGWLDLVFPMAYGAGSPEAYLPKLKQNNLDPAIACGLGPFEQSVDDFVYVNQVRYCRFYGCLGQIAFESNAYINKDIGKACIEGPYAERAATPSWDKIQSLAGYAGFIKQRINETCLYLGYMDEAKAAFLTGKIDDAISKFETQSQKAIEDLITEFNMIDNPYAKKALLADGEYLKKINALPEKVTFSTLPGDANCDGRLNVADYIYVRLHILGIHSLEGQGLSNADIDSNGKINVTDYIIIRLKLLGII
ncbi:MAG: family 10 glycosylhydrolase [Clostridiales bacterium]|nr:family 10 glycosylhydrolase [Clostridiales bacterium]